MTLSSFDCRATMPRNMVCCVSISIPLISSFRVRRSDAAIDWPACGQPSAGRWLMASATIGTPSVKSGCSRAMARTSSSEMSVAGDVSPEVTYLIISCSSTRMLTVSTSSLTATFACVVRLMQRRRDSFHVLTYRHLCLCGQIDAAQTFRKG